MTTRLADVVAEDQIRLVIRTFRDRLPTEIFPGRTEVPKTLVFAKTDNHAEDIVNVIREEFGKGNEFCQKITSKTTGMAPEDLLAQFRNSFNPRIAVTVDMIATGTDVKALEVRRWLARLRVQTLYIAPGSPWENGYNESFNGACSSCGISGRSRTLSR